MKALKTFTVKFASFADGEHNFDYQVDNKFLKHFEASLVQEANIEVNLSLLKYLNSLEFNFKISGTVLVPCDVCIKEFHLPIKGNETITVKIVSEIPDETDEYNIVYIGESSSSINIAEMLYELIMLSIPMKKVHPHDEDGHPTCDPEVLKFLLQEEDYSEEEESDENDSINPIWGELKNLK
jgi:uncharacterized protein